MSALREVIRRAAERHGLVLAGVTSAAPLPDARRHMEESAAAGRMARMGWMGGERPALATDPQRLAPAARSAVVVAAPYVGAGRAAWNDGHGTLPGPIVRALDGLPREPTGQVARYALGGDYHAALRTRLQALADDLAEEGIGLADRPFVDDRPLAERALAARAGIGWIGKNTNVLTHDRAGSWVFLGAILTDAELPVDEPLRTTCGACTRCLTGCPTGALVAPQTIDARRCISYLTIEHPGALDAWESDALGTWIYGCDVCQEVCPVNADADDDGALRVPLIPLARELLPMSGRAFGRAFAASAMSRAGRHRLLRNVLTVLGNAPLAEIREEALEVARAAASDHRPEVRAAAERLEERASRA